MSKRPRRHPAYESGISPGDLILEVDGESTKGMALNDCVKRITGAEGTIVTLKVQKPDAKEPVEIKLKRRMIHITSVKGLHRAAQGTGWDYLIDPQYKIGYIRVTQFTKDTEEELKSALSACASRAVPASFSICVSTPAAFSLPPSRCVTFSLMKASAS